MLQIISITLHLTGTYNIFINVYLFSVKHEYNFNYYIFTLKYVEIQTSNSLRKTVKFHIICQWTLYFSQKNYLGTRREL